MDYMNRLVSANEVMANMGMYFIISIALFLIMDYYARKKIGGKQMLGYKILRIPKFFSMLVVSGYTIVIFVLCRFGVVQLTYSTMTYLGILYFVVWVFYLVNVLRRVRAETRGRS